MRISLTEEGKKLSFEDFVEQFGEAFKAHPEPLHAMGIWYAKLTGNDAGRIPKKSVKAKH